MLQGFEDAFTDAQARTISLALELLENNKKEADPELKVVDFKRFTLRAE